mgnify:CR=1 FL=1
MKITSSIVALLLLGLSGCGQQAMPPRLQLAQEIESTWVETILHAWYPRVVDQEYGGYLTRFDYQWQLLPQQPKMIVTQARHVWTTAKAAQELPDDPRYRSAATHGFRYLKTIMWDTQYGGFYQLRTQEGETPDSGERDEKRTYGNAFGLYAVAAYYELTHDPEALDFAQQIFQWLEDHAYDPVYGGYYQHLRRDGRVIERPAGAEPRNVTGLKDQNTSIHLLEAFTELYKVWPDTLVRQRLLEMLHLIRDTIITDRGHLVMFFQPDWTPVSFQDSTKAFIRQNYYVDHVSFGHDVETAFLMLEASHVLGIEEDELTLTVAKRMVDHALANGWDHEFGGIFDVGYYFAGEDSLTILTDHKTWWSQVEALNAFLMMSLLFPDEEIYYQRFLQQWHFIDTFLIDHQHGGVYPRPIARHEDAKTANKAQEWKGSYHNSRALMNSVRMLKQQELPF